MPIGFYCNIIYHRIHWGLIFSCIAQMHIWRAQMYKSVGAANCVKEKRALSAIKVYTQKIWLVRLMIQNTLNYCDLISNMRVCSEMCKLHKNWWKFPRSQLVIFNLQLHWLLYLPLAVTPETLRFCHRVYLYVSYDSHIKQELFLPIAWINFF